MEVQAYGSFQMLDEMPDPLFSICGGVVDAVMLYMYLSLTYAEFRSPRNGVVDAFNRDAYMYL